MWWMNNAKWCQWNTYISSETLNITFIYHVVSVHQLTHWGREKWPTFPRRHFQMFEFLFKISPKFVPKGPINNIPALVRIMAGRRTGDKLLSESMMVKLPTHICVTRPQWVKKNVPWLVRWKNMMKNLRFSTKTLCFIWLSRNSIINTRNYHSFALSHWYYHPPFRSVTLLHKFASSGSQIGQSNQLMGSQTLRYLACLYRVSGKCGLHVITNC